MAFYCVTDIKKRTYTKQGADSLLLAVCALFFCLIQHHKSKAFQKTHKILVLTCGYIKFRKEKPTHDCFTLNTSVSSSDLNGHIQLWQIADSLQSEGTKCYPNIFLSVYIHVNTKTAFSFFQYPHTSLFVFAYPQQPRLLLFVYKFQILLQKQSYSFHDS